MCFRTSLFQCTLLTSQNKDKGKEKSLTATELCPSGIYATRQR